MWRDLLYSQAPLEGQRPFSSRYSPGLLPNHVVAKGLGKGERVCVCVYAYFLTYQNSNMICPNRILLSTYTLGTSARADPSRTPWSLWPFSGWNSSALDVGLCRDGRQGSIMGGLLEEQGEALPRRLYSPPPPSWLPHPRLE